MAAKLQTAAIVSGVTYTGLSTGLDTIARYQGNQAAVDWFDKVNRTPIISDDPNVQLVTSFTVNPFHALGLAKTGVVRLASGLGDVTIGKALGARFTRAYTHAGLLDTQIQKMYRLGSQAEAAQFIETNLGGRGEAYDQVVGLALQTTLQRLPETERAALAALPPVERLQNALKLHGGEAMRLLEKEPDLLASRWYEDFWLNREMPGKFDPEVAALISRDYRAATKRTYELRSQIGAVVGRADYVPPRGVEIARQWLDRVADPQGNVRIKGVDGLQDLQRQIPGLSRYRQGLIEAGATAIPRSAIETMLQRAEQDYAVLTKTNPVRATTATDPILRPNAHPRDFAEALGTSEATVHAIADYKFGSGPGGPVDLMRTLLVDKTGMDPAAAAALTPDEVWLKASDYVDTTTSPWIEMGKRGTTAEKQITGIRNELARLRGLPQSTRGHTYSDQVIRAERELAQLRDLVTLATDPPVPFSEWVRAGRRETRTTGATIHLEEMALRRAQALDTLQMLDGIDNMPAVLTASSISSTPWHQLMRETPISRVLAWAGGASPMSAGFRRRFAQYLRETTDTAPGRESAGLRRAQASSLLVDMGDYEAWDLFRRYPQAMERMTRTQQRYARSIERGTGVDEFSTNYESTVGMNQMDSFLQDLGDATNARAEALQGRSEYNIRRTANMKGPRADLVWYEKSFIADPTSPIYDPSFVAIDHPHNIGRAAIILDRPADLYPGLANVVTSDPVMMNTLSNAAEELGYTIEQLVTDPTNAELVKSLLVPPGWAPPPIGVNPITPLDTLITGGDTAAVEAMTEQLIASRGTPAEPMSVPLASAKRLGRGGIARPSHEWRSSLIGHGVDMAGPPADAVLLDPSNRIGLDVLSVLTHGVPGRPPLTISGTLRILREIENGNAERMGLGAGLQAEGQRVARLILDDARKATKRAGIPQEAFSKGLDPAMLSIDDNQLARDLTKGGVLYYDEGDPLGSLQYVLKKPPSKAVVLEWSQVPGLSEEFLAGRFEPWAERIGHSEVRKLWSFVFGAHSNESIAAATRANFLERAAAAGVETKDAQAIWSRWRDIASGSRGTEVRQVVGRVTGRTVREHLPGDNPLYADVKNIPTRKLDHDAQAALGLTHDVVGPAVNTIDYQPAYLELLRSIDYGTMFREASSGVRRYLKGEAVQIGGGRLPAQKLMPAALTPTLGRALATTYGLAAHNKFATTLYYLFRFGLDLRYHAMNYLEAQFLYLGRAGLKDGQLTTGYMGQSEAYLRHMSEDVVNNTGYAESRARGAYAYKTFLKEQPGRLAEGVKGMQAEDPALMNQVVDELARHDPELSSTIAAMGDTAEAYVKAIDAWHSKMLATVDDGETAAAIDAALAPALADSPALAEVYGRLAEVNKDLWRNVRETFYGNPDRSRAERFLNSYLLYWPLSYQIKSAKWLLRIMYDRAGGIPTNAGGSIILARYAQEHQRLLATDPEYAQWFEKHKTLVFVAQMLAPITPNSMGTSLNPILRDLFFGRSKAPYEIGPVYTLTNVLPGLAKEVYTDLYPTLADAPGFDALYRMTGQAPPKVPAAGR
jgi:hypothetical protein